MPFPPPPASISQRVFMSFYVCRSYSSTSKAFCLPSEKDLSNLCSICLFVSKFVLLPQWFAIEGEAHAVVLALLVVVNHVLEASVLHEGHPLRLLAPLLQRHSRASSPTRRLSPRSITRRSPCSMQYSRRNSGAVPPCRN